MPSAHEDLFRRWIDEAWNAGRVDVLDEMHTPKFRDNSGLSGVAPDTEGMKQFIREMRSGFPDGRITVDDVVSERDRLAVRWTFRGTHTGDWQGLPATGRPVEFAGFDIFRLEDGRFAEVWHLEDMLTMLRQVGAIPS